MVDQLERAFIEGFGSDLRIETMDGLQVVVENVGVCWEKLALSCR